MDSDDDEPQRMLAPRKKRINRKTKLHIVFDEEARREFLTGFRKRKLQRKKVAQEELKQQLKAEKKRIKLEMKQQFKKLVHSYKPIPELEEQLAQEYDVEDTKVSVLELDTDLLADTNFIIGRNKFQYSESTTKEENDETNVKEEDGQLPGMEMKTKKEFKKEVKKVATTSIKKSKAFQKMNLLEKQKQKKKSMKKKKEILKLKAKSKKGKNQKHSFKKKK